MAKKECVIPDVIQREIEVTVQAFNSKYLAKSESKYAARIQGKYIYLSYRHPDGECDNVCRLTYNGDIKDLDFAIFKYSSEKYDPTECFFPGQQCVNGAMEGAMKAGLKAYPV